MKKITVLLMAFSISLVACSSVKQTKDSSGTSEEIISDTAKKGEANSMDWLIGDWHSDTWNVTYTFSQENNSWSIKNNNEIVAENAKVEKDKKGKVINLVSEDGSKIVVTKENNTHIKLWYVAKEGLIGMTDSVEFVKK